MADVIQCSDACTVTLVHEISIPPFQMDTEDASYIAVAILAVWAVGFGVRALIRAVKESDGDSSLEN